MNGSENEGGVNGEENGEEKRGENGIGGRVP